MKKIIITAALIFATYNSAQARLFSTINISPKEFIACQDRGDDPRCRGHIKMGCANLCAKDTSDFPALHNACTSLCPVPAVIEQVAEEPKPETIEG